MVSVLDGVTQLQNYNESLFGLISNLTTTVESVCIYTLSASSVLVLYVECYTFILFQYIDNSYDISSCPTNYFDGLSDIENNVGYLRQCVVNRGFEFIQQYDVYRLVMMLDDLSVVLVNSI